MVRYIARLGCVVALLAMVGCTTVTEQVVVEPANGPVIKAGLQAVMPPVIDGRSWPTEYQDQVNYNVLVFSDQIYDHLRSKLLDGGLFSQLVPADSPQAKEMDGRLQVTIGGFQLEKLGTNGWLVPHLVADGVLLPAFAVTNLATRGLVDMGGYLLPSTRLGTNLNATLVWMESDVPQAVLSRSYIITVERESVSDRQLYASLRHEAGYATEVGRTEGVKALDALAEKVLTDPHWDYLEQFRVLVRAEVLAAAATAAPGEPMTQAGRQVKAALSVLPLVKPMAYAPNEAEVLRDGYLEADMRARVFNDVRARNRGLEGGENLTENQRLTEEQAVTLYDDPKVERALVEGEIVKRALALCRVALTPPAVPAPALTEGGETAAATPGTPPAPPAPGESAEAGEGVPPAPGVSEASGPVATAGQDQETAAKSPAEDTAADQVLRQQLATRLVETVRGKPVIQTILLEEADLAVREAWEPMRAVLEQLDSPAIKGYLANRGK